MEPAAVGRSSSKWSVGSSQRRLISSKWRLSWAAVLGWAGVHAVCSFATATILLLTCTDDLRLGGNIEQGQSDDGGGHVVILGAGARLLGIVLADLGAVWYLRVGRRAPRPRQLHAHGLLLLLMMPELSALVVTELLQGQDMWAAAYFAFSLSYVIWGVRRILFLKLMMEKIGSLGPPPSRCTSIRFWGRFGTIAASMLSLASSAPITIALAFLLMSGSTQEEIAQARKLGAGGLRGTSVPLPVAILLKLMQAILVFGVLGSFVSGFGILLAGRCSIAAARRQLAQRQVEEGLLRKVRRTLTHHWAGVVASMISSNLLIVAAAIDALNIFPEHLENLYFSLAHRIDVAGDALAILLLSGIGGLLFHDGPDTGDVSGQLRSLLFSAVLTSRADNVFEGRVCLTDSRRCIVSFPGAFLPEWNALTWLCEQGETSSACVFLPKDDPKRRFGMHANAPDERCWCHSIYGEEKPWGCLWFESWKSNIAEAMELQLELVVVYLPGQVGNGAVAWDDLTTVNLWDGVGLGGSQKSEVAFLRKNGYPLVEEDVDETRRWLSRCNANNNNLV